MTGPSPRRLGLIGAVLALVAAIAVAVAGGWRTSGAAHGEPARTPPMGFNDWNAVGCGVSERLIEQTADVLAGSGLEADGYTYVNIDDCWMLRRRDARGHLVPDPAKFPDGIAGTARYVHAKGLKLGLYEDAGTQTCAGYPGSLGHEQTDAADFAAWGVDYLKYDNCSSRGDGTLGNYTARYAAMGRALARTGRTIVYSICEWGRLDPERWAGRIGNLWRTTSDIHDDWASLEAIIARNAGLAAYAHPGAWNDPDMLEIGNGGMTDTEYRTHFSLWAEMAAPLLIGTDLRTASPATMRILGNTDVIAVDQDRLGVQGRVVQQRAGTMVFSKPLAGGDRAVALYNSTDSARRIGVSARQAGLPEAPSYRLQDLWTKAVTTTAGSLAAVVPAHGTVLFRVRAVGGP